jgi:hypothetical protein
MEAHTQVANKAPSSSSTVRGYRTLGSVYVAGGVKIVTLETVEKAAAPGAADTSPPSKEIERTLLKRMIV